MHMSWISGNLNELEDPIAKANSWYICGCPIKQLARRSYLVILYDYSPSHNLRLHHFFRFSQAPFPCDVAEKCHLAEMHAEVYWYNACVLNFWKSK